MINQSGEQPAERCLLVLCGLPASGKTTLAKHLLVAASSPPWRDRLSVQIVNFDESLELDAVEFDPTRWKVRPLETNLSPLPAMARLLGHE